MIARIGRLHGAVVVAALAAAAGAQAQSGRSVPLREGLTVVTAIHEPGRGDFESIKRVDALGPDSLHIVYTADRGGGDPIQAGRTVRLSDLQTARRYRNYFSGNEDRLYEGWTALGPSRAVVADLLSKGESGFTFQPRGGTDRDAIEGTITHVGTDPYPVLLNGTRVELQAIKAEGIFKDYKVEFWFLDAPDQPLTLRYHAYRSWPAELQARLEALAKKEGKELPKLSEHRLDVIKIEFPADESGSAEEWVENLEDKLEKEGRAEVYGIYFDFGSDRIRPESAAVIAEIAGLLQRNGGWALSIEGHTDNIGRDAYNLDLSRRRAAAVRAVLVGEHGIQADRLATAGHGASMPKESNDTIAGRARNRRVELMRK